ncbi:branched-chain amino acid ABC transporter permease [Subtercola vilae]|uniref:Branched-chain amino acid ABC transporter permease n=2 Tax=Microbacteriaceae TaxID=85023 RepID=A0A4T2C9S4_9MICO|nr:branched-chain amino acid ABC transporter permease [Subtercola vilae]
MAPLSATAAPLTAASAVEAPASASVRSATIDPASATESIGVWVRLDSNKAAVAGVKVTVTGSGGFSSDVVSGADGKVTVGLPGAGDYTVKLDETSVPAGDGVPRAGTNPRTVTVAANSTGVPAYFLLTTATGGSSTSAPGSTTSPGSSSSDASSGPSLFDLLVPRLASGLIFGLLLALACIGVSLIYGTTGLNNFAHGELVTFGGLMGWVLAGPLGLPGPIAVIGALVLGGVMGYVQDLGLWRPLRKKGVALIPLMIVSVGLSLALRYTFQVIFGPGTLVAPNDTSAAVNWGPVHLRSSDLIGAIVCIVLLLLVAFVLLRTRIGKATRAVSDNKALAAASGINVERVIRLVWIGGGALAGIAGALIGYYQTIRWDTGASILLLIFAAVTLGGLGTAFGALVGSIIIGLFIEVSTIWLPANLKFVAALVVLIIILLIRPQGILGKRDRIG